MGSYRLSAESKYRILKLAFIIWVILWVNFMMRDLIKARRFSDYKNLIARSGIDAKRSYTFGDRFYEFLKFCDSKVPKGSSYALAGIPDGAIELRRASYYLYPDLESANPEYVFVYGVSGFNKKGYTKFQSLDPERYILKREK